MPAQLRPVASEILRRIMELSCVAGGVHQNGRLGRCEAVAKLAATKLAVQNKQCSGCAINSASGF